jgi:hypothetical protein
MWYRNTKTAQMGILNLSKHLFQGAEETISNWVRNDVLINGDLPNMPDQYRGRYVWNDTEVPSWLKGVVKGIDHNVSEGRGAVFNTDTRILSVPQTIDKKTLQIFINRVLHEIRHSVDPRFNKPEVLKQLNKQMQPQIIYRNILDNFSNTKQVISSYDQYIIFLYSKYNSLEDARADPSNFLKTINSIKSVISELDFNKAKNAFVSGHNLYVDNPIEHPNQLGDVRGLLDKQFLDDVKQKYYPKMDIQQWKNYLKNTLINVDNPNFEKLSNQIQEVSHNDGLSVSYIVKNTKDKNWNKKYLSQIAGVINQYEVANPLSSLVRRENRINPTNPNASKNLQTFLTKASQLEALAAKNPDAWNKFINSNFAMKMINNKIYNLFKGVGGGSKSLSQSIKGLNMNSPYWALLEPALEFGLYQFGLFLENPNGYSLETDEQKTIKYIKTKIDEILADNKISDKKGYFMKYYGSTLKTLGTMEQNELLSKFPVMPFNQFMNIGKNIGQK